MLNPTGPHAGDPPTVLQSADVNELNRALAQSQQEVARFREYFKRIVAREMGCEPTDACDRPACVAKEAMGLAAAEQTIAAQGLVVERMRAFLQRFYGKGFVSQDGCVCAGCEAKRLLALTIPDAAQKVRRLVEALRSLRNEVHGAIDIGELGIREAVGNTNVGCIQNCLQEADAALADFAGPSGERVERQDTDGGWGIGLTKENTWEGQERARIDVAKEAERG